MSYLIIFIGIDLCFFSFCQNLDHYKLTNIDFDTNPVNKMDLSNVGFMLDHRLRRWPNVEPTLDQVIVFAMLTLILCWITHLAGYIWIDSIIQALLTSHVIIEPENIIYLVISKNALTCLSCDLQIKPQTA